MTKRSQINFTPTSELRQVIEEEAKRKGLAVSSFIRTKLLDVVKEQI